MIGSGAVLDWTLMSVSWKWWYVFFCFSRFRVETFTFVCIFSRNRKPTLENYVIAWIKRGKKSRWWNYQMYLKIYFSDNHFFGGPLDSRYIFEHSTVVAQENVFWNPLCPSRDEIFSNSTDAPARLNWHISPTSAAEKMVFWKFCRVVSPVLTFERE